MSYQKTVGCLTAKMCEGYCGQDAYNDMFITEKHEVLHDGRIRALRGEREREYASALKQRDYKDATDLIVKGEEKMAEMVVRRLMPEECEMLQGFEPGWTDIGEWTDEKGKVHKPADSPRYKAIGNSVATGPNSFWKYILKRISAQYDREATMGSLFSGIGGFDVVWEQLNGKNSVRWSSEIEPFCVAVLKKHFETEE